MTIRTIRLHPDYIVTFCNGWKCRVVSMHYHHGIVDIDFERIGNIDSKISRSYCIIGGMVLKCNESPEFDIIFAEEPEDQFNA